jgi:alanine dehydrogenase
MHLKRITLPPLKFVITGTGKVGSGAKEILDAIKVKEITIDNYLTKTYTQPVYVQLDVLEYNKRIDGQALDFNDFVEHPGEYVSDFEKFTKVTDIYFAGHFHASGAPMILTREMLNASNNKIKVVADISCDVNGPIACTIRSSTIAEPIYGYWPVEGKEVDVFHPGAVVVMAVDNLPCEIPKDASEGFGEQFMEHVIPAFFNGDKDGILNRSKMTENGKLTPRFSYLQDYVDGK